MLCIMCMHGTTNTWKCVCGEINCRHMLYKCPTCNLPKPDRKHTMVKFKWLTGDSNFLSYGGKWISNRQYNGEFDYYFVIELMNWSSACGGMDAPRKKYHVSLSVVAPTEVPPNQLFVAYENYGIDISKTVVISIKQKVEVIHSYSGGTPVWMKDGNNYKALMKEAHEEARKCAMLFGFYLDRPVNGLGTTGWEALRCASPQETITRLEQEGKLTRDGEIVKKIYVASQQPQ